MGDLKKMYLGKYNVLIAFITARFSAAPLLSFVVCFLTRWTLTTHHLVPRSKNEWS